MRKLDTESLNRLSIRQLQAISDAIPEVIERKRCAPDEDDIAREFSGDIDLIAETLDEYDQAPGYRRALLKLYCSHQHCPACPHGPYWFSIRTNKRQGTRVMRYTGRPFFSRAALQAQRENVRPPIDVADSVQELIKRRRSRGRSDQENHGG